MSCTVLWFDISFVRLHFGHHAFAQLSLNILRLTLFVNCSRSVSRSLRVQYALISFWCRSPFTVLLILHCPRNFELKWSIFKSLSHVLVRVVCERILMKILRDRRGHLAILEGCILHVRTHGGCWTCRTITSVSLRDLKT